MDVDKDKVTLLKMMCSFANHRGGYLVVGMEESEGKPVRITPVMGLDPDELELRIREFSFAHSDFNLPSWECRAIPVAGGIVWIIKLNPSWNGPHMIKYKDDMRYYVRDGNHNRLMKHLEIVDAVGRGSQIRKSLLAFREERIQAILNDDTPVTLTARPRIAFHLLPFESISDRHSVDLSVVDRDTNYLPTLLTRNVSAFYCFEGIYTSPFQQPQSRSYSLLFGEGIIESVDCAILNHQNLKGIREDSLPSPTFEAKVIESLGQYLELYKTLPVNPPCIVTLSLLNIKGYTLLHPFGAHDYAPTKVKRDVFQCRPQIIESWDIPPHTILRPLFDQVWNAFALARCLHYDPDGTWKPRG